MNKYIQNKEGTDLVYPKTLVNAVYKTENGESISEEISSISEMQDVISTALNEHTDELNKIKLGKINDTKLLTLKDIENDLNGNAGIVLSSAQGKVISDYIERLEDILSTALVELTSIKAISRSISDEYKLIPYSQNDLCMHEGLLYRCKTAISSPEV